MLYEEDHAAHLRQCEADAKAITEKYGFPCPTVFVRAIYGMYRIPVHRNGAEYCFDEGFNHDY